GVKRTVLVSVLALGYSLPMQTGNRFRAYPKPFQEQILLQWIGHQRFIYNAKVSEDRYYRTFAKKAVSLSGTPVPVDQEYARFIGPETPWLREVPSQIFRNGAVLWKQSCGRFFSGLAGRPTFKRKDGKQSVWITSELFFFRYDDQTRTEELVLGTKKFPLGVLSITAHTPYSRPSSLHVSVEAGKWYVSFSSDDGLPEPKEEDTVAWLRMFTEEELEAKTLGFDRGVAVPVMASSGRSMDLLPVHKSRTEKKERARRRYQRRLARQEKGSRNRKKTKRRLVRTFEYAKNVRKDVVHKATGAFASDPQRSLFVVEDLKVKHMTKRPEPKKDASGRSVKNGARAKAGLNRAILSSMWGLFVVCLSYKARRNGKLVIKVPSQFSSQECARCGNIHPDNRPSQAEFVCQRCGLKDNADRNAGLVIAKRGIRLLLGGNVQKKPVRRCGIGKRKQLGPERSEVKASGEEDKTRRSKGLRASSAKEERSVARPETPTTASA
ncbi:MAG: RNA-guided endonuclease InsQ/TnpB family protein, partial [Leptospirales bacterium]